MNISWKREISGSIPEGPCLGGHNLQVLNKEWIWKEERGDKLISYPELFGTS